MPVKFHLLDSSTCPPRKTLSLLRSANCTNCCADCAVVYIHVTFNHVLQSNRRIMPSRRFCHRRTMCTVPPCTHVHGLLAGAWRYGSTHTTKAQPDPYLDVHVTCRTWTWMLARYCCQNHPEFDDRISNDTLLAHHLKL